jgi:hypothetical protein
LNGKKAAMIKKEKREVAKLLNDQKEEKVSYTISKQISVFYLHNHLQH